MGKEVYMRERMWINSGKWQCFSVIAKVCGGWIFDGGWDAAAGGVRGAGGRGGGLERF
jgi:hypothetical protein